MNHYIDSAAYHKPTVATMYVCGINKLIMN